MELDNYFFNVNDDFISIIKSNIDKVNSVNFISTGWTNFVYVVNSAYGNYVFRFPRNNFFADALKKEILFSQYINKKISLTTSQLEAKYNKGRIYSMHKMIEGKSLTDCYNELSNTEIMNLTTKLCGFLKELQSLKCDDFKLSPLSTFLTDLSYVNTHDTYDFSVLDPLKSLESETFVLCHGDLNPGNLLLNKNELTAIIDFAFVSKSSNIIDVSRMIGRLPEKFKEPFYSSFRETFGYDIPTSSINELTNIWSYVEHNYINYIKTDQPDIILPPEL